METQHESDSPVLEGTPSAQRRRKRRSKKPKTQKAINSAINSAIEARRARTDERDASSDSLNFVHNTNSPTGEKPYQCGEKLYQFNQANYALGGPLGTGTLPCGPFYQLVSVKKSPTGEKPYQCGGKPYQFNQANYALGGPLGRGAPGNLPCGPFY